MREMAGHFGLPRLGSSDNLHQPGGQYQSVQQPGNRDSRSDHVTQWLNDTRPARTQDARADRPRHQQGRPQRLFATSELPAWVQIHPPTGLPRYMKDIDMDRMYLVNRIDGLFMPPPVVSHGNGGLSTELSPGAWPQSRSYLLVRYNKMFGNLVAERKESIKQKISTDINFIVRHFCEPITGGLANSEVLDYLMSSYEPNFPEMRTRRPAGRVAPGPSGPDS